MQRFNADAVNMRNQPSKSDSKQNWMQRNAVEQQKNTNQTEAIAVPSCRNQAKAAWAYKAS